MRFSITFLFIVCFITNIVAQNSFKGTVVDENNEPMAGAVLTIPNTYLQVISGPNGEFSLALPKHSTFTLSASFIGYEIFSEEIVSTKLKSSFLVEMVPTSILSEEVIVSGTRANKSTPVAFETLSKMDISERNMSQDIPYLMDTSPSFVTTSDGGSGVGYTGFRIRGTDINRINVSMDGVPLNDAESHNVYFVNLPDFASSLQSIQIQRGVGTSSNGSASFGATVNMQTNTLSPAPYADFSSSYGSFATSKSTVKLGSGLLNGKFGFDGRISSIQSDGYIDRSSSDLFSYALSGGYYGDRDILKFNMFSGEEHTYQAWYGVSPEQKSLDRTFNPSGEYIDSEGTVRYYDNQTDNYEQKHYQLFYSHQFLNDWTLNTTAHYTKGEGYYESMKDDASLEEYLLDPVDLSYGPILESDLVAQKWLDNDYGGLTFSLLKTFEMVDFTLGGAGNYYSGDHFGRVIWTEYSDGTAVDHEYYRGKGEKLDLSTYTKAVWSLSSSVNLFTDLQYRFIDYDISGTHDDLSDVTQSHNFSFLNPKLGVLYEINPSSDLYLSYGMSNREPNRSNYVDADENSVPDFETLHDFELGYNVRKLSYSFGANFYYMHYRNQLILTGEINDVGSAVQSNVDQSYRSGLELTGAWQVVPKLKWEGNITFSQNKIIDFEEYVDDWINGEQVNVSYDKTDISFSPNVTANSTFTFTPFSNLRASWISQFVSDQYLDNSSSDERKLESYWINHLKLDFTLRQKWVKHASLSLLVNNLFNNKYESNGWVYSYYSGAEREQMIGLYPQAGINAMVGLNIRF